MATNSPDGADDQIDKQIEKAGLPTSGSMPFVPKLDINRKGKAQERDK